MKDGSGPIESADGATAVREFFRRLGSFCRARDFDSAYVLFDPAVASFGTKAEAVEGLTPLREHQWEQIWPKIEDFEIVDADMKVTSLGDLAWGMVPWRSTGFDEAGRPFDRPGRATAVLERRAGKWLCVHTHFSLAPGIPQRTYGKQPRTG